MPGVLLAVRRVGSRALAGRRAGPAALVIRAATAARPWYREVAYRRRRVPPRLAQDARLDEHVGALGAPSDAAGRDDACRLRRRPSRRLRHRRAEPDPRRSLLRGELMSLYVDPPAQGAGVGTALLAAAEGALREAGYTQAVVDVLDATDAARAFYERFGWQRDDAVHHRKALCGSVLVAVTDHAAEECFRQRVDRGAGWSTSPRSSNVCPGRTPPDASPRSRHRARPARAARSTFATSPTAPSSTSAAKRAQSCSLLYAWKVEGGDGACRAGSPTR